MWWVAFMMGFTGSLHCVAMCGPLAALFQGKGSTLGFTTILYHIGKAMTYALLGIVLSAFGTLLQFHNYQNVLSISAGVMMLLWLALPTRWTFQLPFTKIVKLVGTLSRGYKKYFSAYLLGTVNGLLPCGLLYMALVVAAVQPTTMQTISFMLFFALGTFPALFLTGYSLNRIPKQLPFSFKTLSNFLLFAIGVLLIVRGLYFGITISKITGEIEFCL